MSYAVKKWAGRQTTGGHTLKSVLLALADYADDTGFCYPSQKSLAKYLELTDRAIRTALAGLEERGFISRDRRQTNGFQRQSDGIRLNYSAVAENGSGTIGEPGSGMVPDTSIAERPSSTVAEPPSGIIAERGSVHSGTSFRILKLPIELPLEEDSLANARVADGNNIATDYDKLLFDEGKKIAAGSMIAKLKKVLGGDPVQALEIVRIAASRSDPLAYLSAAMRKQERRHDNARRHLDAIDEAARAARDYFDRIGVPRLG